MWHGGLAELCKLPAHHLVRLPDDVSFEAASCLACAYGTALRMMYTIGRVKEGEKVPDPRCVGRCRDVLRPACQAGGMRGHRLRVQRLEARNALKNMGADHLLDYTREDFRKWVYGKFGKPHRRKFDGDGLDVVVNFTGGDTWAPSLKVVKRRGRILTCGATAGYDPTEDLRFIWSYEISGAGLQRMDARGRPQAA